MDEIPLEIQKGHLFLRFNEGLLLLDSGSPQSFGRFPQLEVAGRKFDLQDRFLELTPSLLSGYVGVECQGLLGLDILGEFDLIIDALENRVIFSSEFLSPSHQAVPLEFFMGIPILSARIGSDIYRMFFDTGAQISYLQDDILFDYPPAGQVQDFYPGFGEFMTETHLVGMHVGGRQFSLRCGRLPDLLGMTLGLAGVAGILGNECLQGRKVGYFPRRRVLDWEPVG